MVYTFLSYKIKTIYQINQHPIIGLYYIIKSKKNQHMLIFSKYKYYSWGSVTAGTVDSSTGAVVGSVVGSVGTVGSGTVVSGTVESGTVVSDVVVSGTESVLVVGGSVGSQVGSGQ